MGKKMAMDEHRQAYETYATFGELLKYLRIRAQLSQRKLGIATGYSESQISRLERGLRRPGMEAVQALFVPALGLEDEPELTHRLLALVDTDHKQAESTPRGTRDNLPAQLTSFIGREGQIIELMGLLRSQRLVTVTGAGGVGKTRLALRAAARLQSHFRDGVWLAELARISDPELVVRAAAEALGVRQQAGQALVRTLVVMLRSSRLLLVLDNCEHVVEAAVDLAGELLRGCPELHILATSREILDVAGEAVYHCPSLTLPQRPDLESTAESEAGRLFVERARVAWPAFRLNKASAGAVAQICLRLDGIPLALELAAARMRVLTVEQIAGRLEDVFELLGGGSRAALPHHRTLWACIDWSYQMLTAEEQVLLARLSVFAGGWTLEAAEEVCSDSTPTQLPAASAAEEVCSDIDPISTPGSGEGEEESQVWKPDLQEREGETGRGLAVGDVGDMHERQVWKPDLQKKTILNLLGGLVDKSLVQFEPTASGEPRYHMLETVRQYTRERLMECGGEAAARQRHLDYYLALAERAAPHLRAHGAREWLDRLEREIDNIRLALDWSQVGAVEKGLRLAAALLTLWWTRGRYFEGADWLERLLQVQKDRPDGQDLDLAGKVARGRALNALSQLVADCRNFALVLRPDSSTAAEVRESQAIFTELGEDYRLDLAVARYNEANGANDREALLACRDQFLALREPFWAAECDLKLITLYSPDDEKAFIYGEEGLALCREIGDTYGEGRILHNLSFNERGRGDLDRSRVIVEQSVACLESAGDRIMAAYVRGLELTGNAIAREEYAEAARRVEEQRGAAVELNIRGLFELSLYLEALVATYLGDYEQAIWLCQEGLRMGKGLPDEAHRFGYYVLIRAAYFQGNLEKARAYIRSILEIEQLLKQSSRLSFTALLYLGMTLAREGQHQPAGTLLGAQDALARWSRSWLYPQLKLEYEQALDSISAGLGEEAFTAAWEVGQAMSFDQVVELALDLCGEGMKS